MLKHNRGAKLVDIRQREEFSQMHIISSINIPQGTLKSSMELGELRDSYIVIIGKGETDSLLACRVLTQSGIRQMSYVAGGIERWLRDAPQAIERTREAGESR